MTWATMSMRMKRKRATTASCGSLMIRLRNMSVNITMQTLAKKSTKMVKDCPLRTTEMAKSVIKDNFKARYESDILPAVRKGTALTGDNFWKGL